MKHAYSQAPIAEPMVGARHVSRELNLPLYYFTKPQSRQSKRIPYYQIGQMIRFRMSEMQIWVARFRAPNVEGGNE